MRMPMEQVEEARFEMAPMIDMVFLLLVFFMCASHLSVVQNVELEIPTATRAVVPRERPDRFTVNITADGQIYGGGVPVTVDELKSMVSEQRNVQPELRVYLRADQKTAHRHVKTVMNAMGELGIDDFIFGAFLPGGQETP